MVGIREGNDDSEDEARSGFQCDNRLKEEDRTASASPEDSTYMLLRTVATSDEPASVKPGPGHEP